MELWTTGIASPRRAAQTAARAEEHGWDGLVVVDSQNLSGDSYVALAVAATATTKLGLGTGVTNPITRHPAVTATAIASIQRLSGGRAVLGIGRGDSALAHLGRSPARVRTFERYVEVLQKYLRGEPVAFDELEFAEQAAPAVEELDLADTPEASRIQWLSDDPKVPVEVAATGPRVIAAGARHAERVMFTLGAEPERIAWGIETARNARDEAGLDPDGVAFGSYINLVAHPDLATARELVSGGLTTFARFSVMHGDVAGPVSDAQRQVLRDLHGSYDMREHTRVGSPQTGALTPEFVERFAIVGSPKTCVRRLEELAALGLDKFILTGPTAGADREQAAHALDLLNREVLPAIAR
jgi:5,10-methylenetetrahydromethanopterin reductase